MDSTLSSSFSFLIFAISICFYAFIVQSQFHDFPQGESPPWSTFMISPPPPPPPPPPPTPMVGSSTPPFEARSPSRSPVSFHPRNADFGHIQSPPPPPPIKRHGHHHHHRFRMPPPPPPPPPPHGMNTGKKVGLCFVGIAVIMQIAMVGFLVIKRRQLLKASERYENCS